MLKKFFSISGKLNRLQYLLVFIIQAAVIFLLNNFIDQKSSTLPIWIKLIYLLLSIFFIIQTTKRCRDIGISGWWQLIPGSPIVFLLTKTFKSNTILNTDDKSTFSKTHDVTEEIVIKTKKNLIYVACFSIIMLFAGFTSAYIVSMGDTFWVKYPLPLGFWFSSAAILLSSITYILACHFSKKGNFAFLKIFMSFTLIFGLLFVYFQWKGYGQLVDKGANFRNSILVTDGRYGDYFEIKYLDKFIEVNANDYLINGKILNSAQDKELKNFIKPFEKTAKPTGYSITSLSPKFTLYYQGELVSIQKNKLVTTSGKELKYTDMRRLQSLAWNIRDNRGDFFYKGKLGKDFHIYYKGKELKYKERALYFGNKILSAPLQLKINQSRDTATSYLYIITILHLLHILAAIIYLFRMVLITFKASLTTDNQLSIKLGSIFWHFLGILWLYLLVFLLFIH